MTMIFYDCTTAPSPRRARIILAEKGAKFETVNIDLSSGEQMGEAFRAINPACTVPVLQLDDGTILTDNAGIAAYLEAEYPNPPLFGTSSAAKGLVASWNHRCEFEGLLAVAEALRNSAPMMKDRALTGPVDYQQIPELAERGLLRLQNFFDVLEARLDGREYIATDAFSIADITAVVGVDFARIVRVKPQEHHVNLNRWRENLHQRPSMKL